MIIIIMREIENCKFSNTLFYIKLNNLSVLITENRLFRSTVSFSQIKIKWSIEDAFLFAFSFLKIYIKA